MLNRFFCLASVLFLACSLLPAQSAISLHSGLLQYTSGSVLIEQKPVLKTTTNMLGVKKGETLSTGADGAAEILLTPGVFLRMVENSAIRMDSVALTDTRVSILQGSVMVECDEISKDNNVAFQIGSHEIEVRKKGVFRIDFDPAKLSVIQGDAFVADSTNMTVSSGKSVLLSAPVPTSVKYLLNKKTDDLYLFSQTRSADSAYATNVVSQSMYNTGSSCFSNSWYYMQPVGMYAYLPCGQYMSAFGYSFFGLNNGFMYTGNPYYYPPPGIIANGFASGYGYGYGYGNGYGVSNYSGGTVTPVKPVKPGTVTTVQGKQTPVNAMLKVPTYTGVLSSKPTYVSLPQSAYMAHVGPAATGFSGNTNTLHGNAVQNRYMGATSLSVNHSSVSSYRGSSSGSSSGGSGYSGGGRVAMAAPSVSTGSIAAAGHSAGSGGGSSHH
ncbi:MAG: FecR family protein [Bryobacteraceae bacterium]